VHDGVHSLERASDRLAVADICLHELDLEAVEVAAASPDEVVEAADVEPRRAQLRYEVGADEAAGAGDENSPGDRSSERRPAPTGK
jgi:hypothetical protein